MIKKSKGYLTDDERLEIEIQEGSKLFSCHLKSFDGCGIVPKGELGTLLAPRGAGKSALIKTIISAAAANKVKTSVVISEEKISMYKKNICQGFEKSIGIDEAKNRLSNIEYTSMIEWNLKEKTNEVFLDYLEREARDGVEFIIFDNFTTSFYQNIPINQQGDAITQIRKLAGYYNISILCVFHTAKGLNIYDRLYDGEDVRGNAMSTNTAGYNYVLTTYYRAKPPRSFLHIDKARYHTDMNKTYWELTFNPETGLYISDQKMDALDVDMIRSDLKKLEKNKGKNNANEKKAYFQY